MSSPLGWLTYVSVCDDVLFKQTVAFLAADRLTEMNFIGVRETGRKDNGGFMTEALGEKISKWIMVSHSVLLKTLVTWGQAFEL